MRFYFIQRISIFHVIAFGGTEDSVIAHFGLVVALDLFVWITVLLCTSDHKRCVVILVLESCKTRHRIRRMVHQCDTRTDQMAIGFTY